MKFERNLNSYSNNPKNKSLAEQRAKSEEVMVISVNNKYVNNK